MFPVEELDLAARQAKRIPTTDRQAVKEILALQYGRPITKLAQTLLFDERSWGVIAHNCDHIFPLEGFNKYFRQYKDLANNFGNLTLLTAPANNEKRAVPFEEWICTQEVAFLDRHLIPQSPELWKFERFPDFMKERERLILDRLYRVLGTS